MSRTVREILKFGLEVLENGKQTPGSEQLELELIIANQLNLSRLQVVTDMERLIDDERIEIIRNMIQRRASGEPLAYILGRKEFWGMDFQVGPGVLVPRPETEHLVERAIDLIVNRRLPIDAQFSRQGYPRILDVGTGSGCIAISVALELRKQGIGFDITGVDISTQALKIADTNLEQLLGPLAAKEKFQLVHSDVYSGISSIDGPFDLVLSNPPYIPNSEPALPSELSYEPSQALFAEDHGLAIIERIVSGAPQVMRHGAILIEIGANQSELMRVRLPKLLPNQEFSLEFIKDLAGWERIMEIGF